MATIIKKSIPADIPGNSETPAVNKNDAADLLNQAVTPVSEKPKIEKKIVKKSSPAPEKKKLEKKPTEKKPVEKKKVEKKSGEKKITAMSLIGAMMKEMKKDFDSEKAAILINKKLPHLKSWDANKVQRAIGIYKSKGIKLY